MERRDQLLSELGTNVDRVSSAFQLACDLFDVFSVSSKASVRGTLKAESVDFYAKLREPNERPDK